MSEDVNAARIKIDDLSETVHSYRNTQGVASLRSLLDELEKGCLKSMASGTRDSFDFHKGSYHVITRLIATIDVGPRKYEPNGRG